MNRKETHEELTPTKRRRVVGTATEDSPSIGVLEGDILRLLWNAGETVFGFLRAVLGYSRWLLRGTERVRAEARLFTAAYQLRKVHTAWSTRTN